MRADTTMAITHQMLNEGSINSGKNTRPQRVERKLTWLIHGTSNWPHVKDFVQRNAEL